MKKKTNEDLRIIRTKKMLCDAFFELLNETKFEDITINDLCEKAMIRRATFYTHFYDKYDFFSYFVSQIQEKFSKEYVPTTPDAPLKEYYLHMFRNIIHFFNQNMGIVKNVINSSAFPILMDIISDNIYQELFNKLDVFMKGKEIVLDEETSKVLLSFFSGGIVQILRRWVADKEKCSEEVLVKQYSLILNLLLENYNSAIF